MPGRYPIFDRSRVQLNPLAERINDLLPGFILPLKPHVCTKLPTNAKSCLEIIARAMLRAQESRANNIIMMGGHVLRAGVQSYLFDLMEHGHIQGIAVNGSVAVHDFEIALQYATTESVARYIKDGQFGLWADTGKLNDIINEGIKEGLGFGEALGREISEGAYPYKHLSLFARAWNLGIPVTVHAGIGYDIVHPHPNCDGAALGAASYRDFLIFAQLVSGLEGGVLISFGSAVMAPEVFLKALSLVRNVARQEDKNVSQFTTLVCDLLDLPQHPMQEAPKSDPHYYFRPWKTLLARTVADGGRGYYVCGHHKETIPYLWKILRN